MLSMRQVRGCSREPLNGQAVADLTLQNVRPCYQIPFCSMKYLYTPYPDATNMYGVENSPQLSMLTQCKPNHTRRHGWASAGHAGAKGTHTQARGTVEVRERRCKACAHMVGSANTRVMAASIFLSLSLSHVLVAAAS